MSGCWPSSQGKRSCGLRVMLLWDDIDMVAARSGSFSAIVGCLVPSSCKIGSARDLSLKTISKVVDD